MYLKSLSFIFFLFCSLSSISQTVDWMKNGGFDLSDKGTKLVMDKEGNTYMTGYYNEQASFGSISIPFSNPHSKEVFIAKIDPSGNYLWVKNGVNYYDDRGLGICLDDQNNVYVTGTCWGGITFGALSASTPSNYTDNIFFIKLDQNGNFLHLEVVGCDEGDDHGTDVAFDGNGHIYVTGFISSVSFFQDGVEGYANFGSVSVFAPEDSLSFLAKFDIASNNWLWVETFDGEDLQKDNRVALDAFGNPYVCGGYKGTVDFGTQTHNSVGGRDIFITKYDPAGNHVLAATAGSLLDDRADAIAIGADNHVYITGEFKDKAAFGLDTINNNGGANGKDIFVARMDLNGNWKWAKKAGSNGGKDRGTGICINNKYNVFVSGEFKGEAKFGGDIVLDSGADSVQFFVAAIDTLGKWQWAKQGGGLLEDRGTAVACDTSCNVTTCGYYLGNSTFETTALAPISNLIIKKDIFVAKIKDACFSYAPPVVPPVIPEDQACVPLEGNIFTPNNDGDNDNYVFTKSCTAQISNVVIVNRWGNVVYSSNDITKSWDGKDTKGIAVSEGVYFYTLNYSLNSGFTDSKKGFISVFR